MQESVENHAFGRYRLIAHRGGVVEGRHPENSAAAVAGAVDRGYAMVEIDVRLSADGEIVCFHDERVRRRMRRVASSRLTLPELRRRAGGWILTLEQMVELCEGRIDVMVDTKSDPTSAAPDLFERMHELFQKHGLLRRALFIGTNASKAYFRDHAATAVSYKSIARGERPLHSIRPTEFLFGHGTEIDAATAEQALALGLRVVPSVNRFHYFPRRTTVEAANADILRLAHAGCTEFQIDSEYDGVFVDLAEARRPG